GKGPKGEGNPLKPPHPPGSERWVRETWDLWASLHDRLTSKYHAHLAYKADPHEQICVVEIDQKVHLLNCSDIVSNPSRKWRPPVTMPRWASRLSVTVAGVEARQVQTV